MPIRVFLVDDHEIVRRGITNLIEREPDLEVVGEAATVRGARGRIAALSPDVAVLDVHLPDGNGIDLCRDIRSAHPSVRCLILTAYDDTAASYAAVLAGASGYVLKDIQGQGLVDGIRRAAHGESLMGHAVTRAVVARLTAPVESSPELDLTLRERQVLRLIAHGMTNREIGIELELAEKTVKNYVSGLLAKLGVSRRVQAAVVGARLEQESPDPP
ncbi:MAG: DNA-binding response regulator [Microbacteriaceae bacterium]|jgi:two-component system response regulator DevR|nr:DNA-binding response regulator [Microbacteriaceae bacterium]